MASADHASTNPKGTRVLVWLGDDSFITVSGLHIAAIEKEAPKGAKAKTARLRLSFGGIAMQTHVEFRAKKFPAYEGEEEQINPGLSP